MTLFRFINSGKYCGLLVMLVLQTFAVRAQTFIVDQSEITVRGIAREKPWSMTTNIAEGVTEVTFSDGKLTNVQLLNFSINVTGLKSGNPKMDERAHKALKSYPYDVIRFVAKDMKLTQIGSDSYILFTDGNLYIGGITQIASLMIQIDVNTNGTLRCSGSKEIKLADFNVALRPAEQDVMRLNGSVKIEYQLILKKAN